MTLEDLRNHLKKSNASQEIGFEIVDAERGRALLQLNVQHKHRQIQGVVHGGVLASIADSAGGMATYMSVPKGSRVVTLEMKINFLEGVPGGTVTAKAKVLRLGRHTSVVDCEVRNANRLVAKALNTYFVLPPARENRRKKS